MIRLLLVEDDPTSRGFLHDASLALPAEVDIADTLASAHALALRTPHDVWLIDANLPDGSGIELLAGLRSAGLRTPAIAHTAARESEALAGLRAAGFAVALCKPLSAQDWRAAIRQVLVRRARVEDAAPRFQPQSQADIAAAPLWDRAGGLAAVGGHEANAAALRDLFLGELPGTRHAIDTAARARDDEALRAALHRLRAGCGFVGADRLGRSAAALHAAPDSPDVLQQFLGTLDATLSRR
ncbi:MULTISPECIES: response regulator [Luteimonas]|uniref:response regulator n=1 Tax=Luteimonas TaxID=83614 RepID=UPI000C7C707E|nr:MULTISPECIES: response regulator [Luteimonas]